jgi:hypothetical protein
MVMLHDCIACQYGDHSGHHEVIQAVDDDVIGGAACGCDGNCAERYKPPAVTRIERDPDADAAWAETFEFLSRFQTE